MHYYQRNERNYLKNYYSSLSDRELAYEYVQPDCLNCKKYLEEGGSLPDWCHECHTIREEDSPLSIELCNRHYIDVFRMCKV